MKLATLHDGTRDGRLVVVSKDLAACVVVPEIAETMQQALDHWDKIAPELEAVYKELMAGTLAEDSLPFQPEACESPLPRAYQWADGSAYVTHVELVRKARGASLPDSFWEDPLMYQGGSDTFLAPCADIPFVDAEWGLDFEGEVAVITGDVPAGADVKTCEDSIRLVMLVNDVSLRGLIPGELAKGFGFFQSKPSSAFSPVAVTLDELGDHWQDGRLHLPMNVTLNDKPFGHPNAGVDMHFNFPQLVAHAAKTRPLGAGCIVGSGTVSNSMESTGGKDVGSACLAERRMLEVIDSGTATTPFLKPGDTLQIDMADEDGNSIFGTIDQKVAASG
ncbi:MAG: fumarylacetoacetate hydrolase family protein [Alphaproteobacteria bacterium]